MKTLLFIFLLAIVSVSLNAQTKKSLVYGNALVRYKNMEKTGTLLTIIGGVALFTGNVLYWKTYNNHDNGEPQANKAATYGYVMVGGLGLLAVGVPLWATAKAKEKHIRIEAGLVKFNGLVSANGVGLRIRF